MEDRTSYLVKRSNLRRAGHEARLIHSRPCTAPNALSYRQPGIAGTAPGNSGTNRRLCSSLTGANQGRADHPGMISEFGPEDFHLGGRGW